MTVQKSLKRRVRARMARTGERYTAARRQLIAHDSEPLAATPAEAIGNGPDVQASTSPGATAEATAEVAPAAPPDAAPDPLSAAVEPAETTVGTTFRGDRTSSDEAVLARTGRTRSEWFDLLTAWGAADRPHPEIARWLVAEHGVNGWWAQELTVAFEMATGRRRPGERPDGFSITASKTIAVPVERVFEAFVDPDVRGRWLPGGELRVRTANPHRTARFDWADGSERVAAGFTPKNGNRCSVALEHSRLPDIEAGERRRAFWRERLAALQGLLEG